MTGVLACDMYLVLVLYLFRYQTDQVYEYLILLKKLFLFVLCISAYSIDKGCIQQAMVQYP